MVERYHFFKLKPAYATPTGRAEVVDELLAVLPRVRGVVKVLAGVPADADAAASWDVSLVVRFAHVDDVATYRADPVHRRLVEQFMTPRIEVKKSWNFAVRAG
jgi:hypothetical protein